jgi:DNA-directed RNA polymerase specialized sigma24 family protein
MVGQAADSETRVILADIEELAKQAARPPNSPLTNKARDSLGRIYQRFIARVYAFCYRRCRPFLPSDILLEGFVEDLFFRFVRSADKIKLDESGSADEIERQLLSCFHGHARWELKSVIKKAATTDQLTDTIMRDIATSGTNIDIPSSRTVNTNRLKLRAELEKLDPRARDVLLTSYQHQDLNTHQFQLPDHVRDELCKRCNFSTPNALAQYRLRRIADLRLKFLSVA